MAFTIISIRYIQYQFNLGLQIDSNISKYKEQLKTQNKQAI